MFSLSFNTIGKKYTFRVLQKCTGRCFPFKSRSRNQRFPSFLEENSFCKLYGNSRLCSQFVGVLCLLYDLVEINYCNELINSFSTAMSICNCQLFFIEPFYEVPAFQVGLYLYTLKMSKVYRCRDPTFVNGPITVYQKPRPDTVLVSTR